MIIIILCINVKIIKYYLFNYLKMEISDLEKILTNYQKTVSTYNDLLKYLSKFPNFMYMFQNDEEFLNYIESLKFLNIQRYQINKRLDDQNQKENEKKEEISEQSDKYKTLTIDTEYTYDLDIQKTIDSTVEFETN